MQEIKLSELTKQEAYELDQRLAYCASAAFREAIAAQKADNNYVRSKASSESYNNYEMISKLGINVLASSYADSLFVSDDDDHIDHVRARLQFELNRYIPSDNHERQEVLIPIMAYALIVSNEYNEETVKKRIQADKRRDSSNKGGTYPYNCWKQVNPYIIRRSEVPPKSSPLIKSFSAMKHTIKDHNAYAICNNHCVVCACTLQKNYRILAQCQDIAKIALFLRRILIDSHNSRTPMNSLIRLYMANYLDNILQRSYALSDGIHTVAILDKKPRNNLLSCYYDSFEKDDRIHRMNHALAPSIFNEPEHTPLNLEFREDYGELSFSRIYHDLIDRYSISEQDLNMLLDFYLDGETLSGYTKLISDTKSLAQSICNTVQKQIMLPAYCVTDAMMDLTYSILRRKKNLPVLQINPNVKGIWHGTRIERYLCVPRIYLSR